MGLAERFRDILGIKDVRVFTVAGKGSSKLLARAPKNNFPAQIWYQLNQGKFYWEPISYSSDLPFKTGYDEGVANLTDQINFTKGKFVLVGHGQGAMICSAVYKSLKSGDLSDRYEDDFLGGVVLGNPCRPAGAGFQDFDTAGHGIAGTDYRLTDFDDKWHEFAIPDDIFTTAGDDAEGEWLSTTFTSMFEGGVVPDSESGDATAARQLLGYFGVTGDDENPEHYEYDTYVPTYDGADGRTCTKLAVDFINSLDHSLF